MLCYPGPLLMVNNKIIVCCELLCDSAEEKQRQLKMARQCPLGWPHGHSLAMTLAKGPVTIILPQGPDLSSLATGLPHGFHVSQIHARLHQSYFSTTLTPFPSGRLNVDLCQGAAGRGRTSWNRSSPRSNWPMALVKRLSFKDTSQLKCFSDG